jgi:hypothetical protein
MANGRESDFPTNGHGFRRNCSCMHRRGRTHDDGQIHQGSGAAPAHHLTVQAPDTYIRPLRHRWILQTVAHVQAESR